GVAGGLAMLVAGLLKDRLGARAGVRSIAAGASLTYAAALGAAYGVLRSHLPRRPAARTALVSALSYAMHLPRRDEPGAPAELSPVFGLATAAAFDALAGR
ncbi:MAG: hypothetical protein ACREOF_17955, partial [Gemmatimonadales bacterium]